MFQFDDDDSRDIEKLTKREIEVLELIAVGLTDRQIAQQLVNSYKTIESHVRSIIRKLKARNRTDAAVFAVKHGLI